MSHSWRSIQSNCFYRITVVKTQPTYWLWTWLAWKNNNLDHVQKYSYQPALLGTKSRIFSFAAIGLYMQIEQKIQVRLCDCAGWYETLCDWAGWSETFLFPHTVRNFTYNTNHRQACIAATQRIGKVFCHHSSSRSKMTYQLRGIYHKVKHIIH